MLILFVISQLQLFHLENSAFSMALHLTLHRHYLQEYEEIHFGSKDDMFFIYSLEEFMSLYIFFLDNTLYILLNT